MPEQPVSFPEWWSRLAPVQYASSSPKRVPDPLSSLSTGGAVPPIFSPSGLGRCLLSHQKVRPMTPADLPDFLRPSAPILRLNGVATPLSEGLTGEGFLRDATGAWRPLVEDGSYEVEEQCIRLHDALAVSIFGSADCYYTLLPRAPTFLAEAGLNSESTIGRDEFEKLLPRFAKFPELNRFLYLYDCQMLVSSIQVCTLEVRQLLAEFYRILNLEPFFTPGVPQKDGTRWTASANVTSLNATLGFLFIRMHSLLDYLTKLAREVESLRTDFATYPKLASSNVLFGDKHKLSIGKQTGTLFETCDEVDEVERIRNLLIHDGLLDDMPKAYEVIKKGAAIERFVLMPDASGAQFERFKNRRLFYSREDKINLRLTGLVRAFQLRQVETLKAIRSQLTSAPGDTTLSKSASA